MTLAYSFISVRQHIGEVFGAMITAFPSPFTAKPTREQRSRIQASKEKKKKQLPQEGLFLEHFQYTHHHFYGKKHTLIL